MDPKLLLEDVLYVLLRDYMTYGTVEAIARKAGTKDLHLNDHLGLVSEAKALVEAMIDGDIR